jgi:hypothetical protein
VHHTIGIDRTKESNPMTTMRLLTISGSLRTGSFNTQLLTHAEDLAREAGHQVHRFNHVSRQHRPHR